LGWTTERQKPCQARFKLCQSVSPDCKPFRLLHILEADPVPQVDETEVEAAGRKLIAELRSQGINLTTEAVDKALKSLKTDNAAPRAASGQVLCAKGKQLDRMPKSTV
jgi:hypothetical protein